MDDLIPIMRTGQLYRLGMAEEALKAARVAYFLREESLSGLQTAMPVSPSMGPGIWYGIYVPRGHGERGREVLCGLPFEITVSPEAWDCCPAGAGEESPSMNRIVDGSGIALGLLLVGTLIYGVIKEW